MSRTLRSGKDYKKTAHDGKGRYRGCGDRNCPWCIDNRTHNKRLHHKDVNGALD